ncbi:MAG: hypothetical protein U0931_27345 [Vulcanimicrobiota bacterium]
MNKFSLATLILLTAGLALADPLKPRSQGQATACKSNEKNIATALEMYASDNYGVYPTGLNKLVGKNPKTAYLYSIPTCPAAGKDTYSSTYKVKMARRDQKHQMISGEDYFEFHCAGHNHKEAGIPANLPAYKSDQGLIDK